MSSTAKTRRTLRSLERLAPEKKELSDHAYGLIRPPRVVELGEEDATPPGVCPYCAGSGVAVDPSCPRPDMQCPECHGEGVLPREMN